MVDVLDPPTTAQELRTQETTSVTVDACVEYENDPAIGVQVQYGGGEESSTDGPWEDVELGADPIAEAAGGPKGCEDVKVERRYSYPGGAHAMSFIMKKRFCWKLRAHRAYWKQGWTSVDHSTSGLASLNGWQWKGEDLGYRRDFFYHFVRNGKDKGPKSGHWSERQGMWDYCPLRVGCMGEKNPWIHIRGHFDGTWHSTQGG